MILRLTTVEPCSELLDSLGRDPELQSAALPEREKLSEDLKKATGRLNEHILGVFRDGRLSSLSVFLILEEEHYIEMLDGVFRSEADCRETLDYLQERYSGFQADFVFHPANRPLRDLLARLGASFDPEQRKMVLTETRPASGTDGIELLTDRYLDQYLAVHEDDRYWTGAKVAEARDRFRVFLAVDGGTVVGYLDVTHCFDENEPYDLRVTEEHRRKGWGRKLLTAAIEANKPNGMMLMVDADNAPAIALYESMGFTRIDGADSLTANWLIP